MKKFWTVTDANTEHTNSRSQRFPNLTSAVEEARIRIESGRTESVCILECIKIVKRAALPITTEDVIS